VPLYADGGREENIAAFALQSQGRTVVAVAPRLFANLVPADNLLPVGAVWGEARLGLPAGRYRDVLTDREIDASGGSVALSILLSDFSVALLESG
jgi:(1->4)-alpha-D-glucan 1-alpha-D-glucosylmutase